MLIIEVSLHELLYDGGDLSRIGILKVVTKEEFEFFFPIGDMDVQAIVEMGFIFRSGFLGIIGALLSGISMANLHLLR